MYTSGVLDEQSSGKAASSDIRAFLNLEGLPTSLFMQGEPVYNFTTRSLDRIHTGKLEQKRTSKILLVRGLTDSLCVELGPPWLQSTVQRHNCGPC